MNGAIDASSCFTDYDASSSTVTARLLLQAFVRGALVRRLNNVVRVRFHAGERANTMVKLWKVGLERERLSNLRPLLEQVSGIYAPHARLIFAGRLLGDQEEDDPTLGEMGLRHGSMVHLAATTKPHLHWTLWHDARMVTHCVQTCWSGDAARWRAAKQLVRERRRVIDAWTSSARGVSLLLNVRMTRMDGASVRTTSVGLFGTLADCKAAFEAGMGLPPQSTNCVFFVDGQSRAYFTHSPLRSVLLGLPIRRDQTQVELTLRVLEYPLPVIEVWRCGPSAATTAAAGVYVVTTYTDDPEVGTTRHFVHAYREGWRSVCCVGQADVARTLDEARAGELVETVALPSDWDPTNMDTRSSWTTCGGAPLFACAAEGPRYMSYTRMPSPTSALPKARRVLRFGSP